MKTSALFFPFDLFGSGGTRQGVELLADAVQEMLADNKREKLPTRARAYTSKVRFEEFTFEKLADYDDWRGQARLAVHGALNRGDKLLWITGNHLGVLPVYDELPADTLVVQFDAHLDIYNLSDCTGELSHGNFLLHSESPLPALVNLGNRELLLKPDYINNYYRRTFAASELAVNPEPALEYLRQATLQAPATLIDLDCDVFDPAYFPATGHALPFGLAPSLFLRLLDAAWSNKVVGVSLSEFDPARDVRDQSLATLLWLIEYVLLKWHEA